MLNIFDLIYTTATKIFTYYLAKTAYVKYVRVNSDVGAGVLASINIGICSDICVDFYYFRL